MSNTFLKVNRRLLFLMIAIMSVCQVANAQLAFYPFRTAHSSNNLTPEGAAQTSLTSPFVIAGTNEPCASFYQPADNPYNGTGYRVKTRVGGTGVAWPTSIDNNFGFTIPLSPANGYDMNISGITVSVEYIDFDATTSVFTIVPYFQVDNAGPWQPLAGPQTASLTTVPYLVNFGALNETFYSNHTYKIRFYVFNSDGSVDGKNDEMRLKNLTFNGTVYQPIAQPVTVQTVSAASTGKYTASASGTYDFNGTNFYLVKKSGFIWTSVSAAALATMDTTATTKTTNGSAGVMSGPITGLSAGTTYWIRAYIVTQFGIQYGATLQFTTDPPSLPIVTTNPITNILSNKASGGGAIVDSGGLAITSKGMVWNIAGGATLASNIGKVILNGNANSFSDLIKQLQPNSSYCYRAFATNSLGTSYGADVCFTTGAPMPVLTAIPGQIDFGTNFYAANPITVSYILTGAYLNPASGNIAINVPAGAGFEISLSSGSGFGTTLSIPYTGSTLPRTPIFVRFLTNTYGTKAAVITHSGGSVSAADADVVSLSGIIVQSPDDVTNKGNDFWLGFGYQNKMKQAAGSGSEPFLTVYVAAGSQPANVVVEMPGIPGAYYQTFTVPANSTHAFDNFPQGAVPGIDARLSATGISNRAIHVYSTNGAPISVWEYIATTGNSAGGSMIFPTSTWNSNYTVQAYAGKSNNGLPNSFFFAIANEDNTEVTITPSSGIIDPGQALLDNPTVLYPANVPFTVTLNKGQVFNAIGVITGSQNSATSAGFDLSGTTVSTKCDKKIAVFGGNGRCLVTTPTQCTEGNITAGSDNMIQQMIPSVAWDTKYFTVPTKTMEHNLFRIYVRNATQRVWINDEAHGTPLLTTAGVHPGGADFNGHYTFQAFANGNGGFYALETSDPTEIESDEPISVTQFITAGDCATSTNAPYINPTNTGNNGQGDPEMIIITGAQQAITDAVVYSPSFQNGASGAGYINVVIPAAGVTTFRLDPATNPTQMVDTGRSSYTAGTAYQGAGNIPIANAFKPFPQNPNYYWAKFFVSYPATHVMRSTVPFNATAYGVANGESYGFNAGTAVKNLSSYKVSVNPEGTDSSSTVVRTCVNTPITLKLAFPYPPSLVSRIVWQPRDARITPNVDTTGPVLAGVAVVDDTIIVGGRTFYVYKSPTTFTFAANGLYNVKVTAYGTFASDCPGEDQQTMLVNVGQDILNLAANPACGNPTVPFTADTIPMVGTNILSWEWNFGDGSPLVTTGTLSPQTHTFPAFPTEFKVKLTTKNTVGCISTDSLTIDFGGGLESKFTISKDSVCMNVPVTFTDASTGTGTSGAINSWEWDFGNGVTSTLQIPPAQTYTTPGIKTVSLTVRTPIGCVKTFRDTVVVEATPVAAINPAPAFVCLGDSAAYQDASSIAIGNITGWTWTFDEGAPLTSNLQHPKHLWLTPGNHTTTLSVTSAGGCVSTNTATHTINVNQLPKAGFRYGLNCTTRTITLTDTSNGNGGTITGWTWDFGDGSAPDNTQNPVHIYAASGTYTVTLTVVTANGCRSIAPESITVTIAASPVADFTLPGNTCLPSASPAFINTTTISDGTLAQVTYIWNFGETPSVDYNAPADIPVSPTHVFSGTGPYTITLTAISNNGCTSTTSKQYTTIYAQPVADIAPLAASCVNGNVSFSSAASTAAGSTITGWAWDFGDGGTDNTQNPTHAYTTAGTKTVQLTITSAAGCVSKIDTAYITVNALPTADFSDTINCTTRSVGFTDLSTSGSGTVSQWNWNFGTGEGTSTLQNPTHIFTNEGNQSVTLTVTTDKGCSSAPVTKPVFINARPVADFDLPGNVCLPTASAFFNNTTTIGDATLPQVTYEWNFGDGPAIVTTPASPTHQYTAVGPFTVTLTATSNNGCKNTVTKSYSKIFAQPVAVITAPTGVCLGNAASFSSTSSTAPASSVTGWAWDFGDAPVPGSSTVQNPTYTYTGSGPRTVTLTVTSNEGCVSAPVTVNFNVNLSPVAGFTYSAIRCEDSTITFMDASTPNGAAITEWNWNFGPGEGTLQQTVLAPATHVFGTTQTYNVSLSVKNANGCVSAAAYSLPVVINPNPVADFNVSAICVGTGIANFTQNVSLSSGQISSYEWNYGVPGSTPGSGATPTYTYAAGGEYSVILKATSDSSCIASVTKLVKVFTAPSVAFDINNAASLCSNLPVGIIDRSAVTGYGSVDKIEIYWDFQGTPFVKQIINAPSANATYTNAYPEFGTPATKPYQVMIRAFNGAGCSTDLVQNIDVLASPQVQFTQPAPVCQEAASFTLTGAADVFGLPGTGAYSGNGINSGNFTPALAGAGTHTIRYTYTTTNGCVDFEEKDIVVDPTPIISFGNRTVINVLEGDVLKLDPTITFGSTYLWTPSTYLNSATSPSPTGMPTDDIVYTLLVTSDKGCTDSKSIPVKVVRKYIVPNTFTPNNDGNHDRFEIENLALYPDVRVRIFSRSGQMVFESYGYNTPWDGKYKGQDCPFGTYYYVIETGGGRGPRTGYVTIIR